MLDHDLIIDGAKEIAEALDQQLADLNNTTVILSRDEALLTLGLVKGIAEILKTEKRQPQADQ